MMLYIRGLQAKDLLAESEKEQGSLQHILFKTELNIKLGLQ